MIDFVIMFGAGLWASLVGFGIIGQAGRGNAKYDLWHSRFAKHLRVLGPLLCVIASALYAYKLVGQH